MALYHIRKYQESDHKWILGLFSRGMEEHIPATFRHMLMLSHILLLLLGEPLSLFLVYDSWILATVCSFTLLLFRGSCQIPLEAVCGHMFTTQTCLTSPNPT
uniref:Uncharacterized protein n=1 Tax=Castor canadensis TaxID=51338 RepID=A0A8C0WU41_CASCN